MSASNHIDVSHVQDASAASALSDSPTVSGSPQNSTFASTSGGIPEEFPAVIPPVHAARTLILCFDGTGDQLVTGGSSCYCQIDSFHVQV